MRSFKKVNNNSYLREQRKDVVSFHYIPKAQVKEFKQVFVWDLDKTYLDTHFDSLSGLIQLIFEKALQKRNVPGTASLVRAIASRNQEHLPLYFISASPPQMHDKIKEKWDIDGIKPYGFFSKDNLKNLKPGRWKRLTKQIGFKLQALMELRSLLSEDCKMICWGDDSESDALIYSLFSDICSHRLTDREALKLLCAKSVPEDQAKLILELRDQRDNFDPVSRVYINLAVDTDPEYYRRFGRRLLAVENTFEVAVDLFQRGFIAKEKVLEIGFDLKDNYSFAKFQLEEAYNLLCKRQRVGKLTDEILRPLFISEGLVDPNYKPDFDLMPLEALPLEKDFENIVRPWIPERVDYLRNY